MSCNNGLFGGSACSWIVILLILSMCCGGDNGIFQNNNGCGCNSCGCSNGCGCDNGCGC